MKNIVTIIENELRLNSNLGESAFGKTHNNNDITQEGSLFDGKNYKVWTFDEVRSFMEDGKDERTVFYCGKNPLSNNAKTLAEYFELGGDDLYKAAISAINAITEAAKSGIKLPHIGAGGIFVDLSTEIPQLLFLPENLYKYSCNGLSNEDYLNNHAGWINQTIYDLPALCFERAVIAYRLLTGRYPYAAAEPVERNADILDRKFLPLELCLNGVNETLASEINKALKLNSSVVNVPGKKQKGKASEDLTPTAEFPIELMEEAWNLSKKSSKEDDKDFEEKVANYVRMRDSKIKLKRNVRRNSSIIFTCACVAVVLVIMIINTVKSNMDEYTSTGLTSIQTIQAFFKGVNTKDTVLLQNLAEGKNASAFTDTVSRVYVLHKQREAYNHDNGFATPERWLLYITSEEKYNRSGIYGITNLKIDEKAYEPEVEMKKKNEKPEPLTKEGNITLEKGSMSVHKIQYYLIRTEGEEVDFVVENVTDTITLTFKGGRWVITDLETESEELNLDCQAFKKDYFAELESNNKDVVKAVENLRRKYQWLPTKASLDAEKARIQYEIEHPFTDLGF